MNKNYKKYLGIDWGEVRIGLALGDEETKMAVPFDVVSDADKILEIINKEKINVIVVGKPIKMSGRKEAMTKGFNEFIRLLKDKIKIPIEFIDERLTSKAADALIGDKKTKASRDAIAAMLILQTFFDRGN